MPYTIDQLSDFRQKMLQKYPNISKTQLQSLDSFIEQKQAVGLVEGGYLEPETAIGKYGTGVGVELQKRGYEKPTEATAEEKKTKQKYADLSSSLDTLEKNYREAELKGPAASKLGILSSITGGAFFPEVRDYEALRKGLIGPVARAISGEVGVLTDRDIKRAEDLLPKLNDTQAVAASKMKNLRSLIASRTGEKVTETEIKPSGGIVDFLLGGTKKYVTETVPEYYAKGMPKDYGEQLKAQLGLIPQAAKSGTELATLATLLPSIFKTGGKVVGGAKKLITKGPVGTLGEIRSEKAAEAALKGIKIEGEGIANAVMKAADDAPTTARKAARKYALEAIEKYSGKTFTPQQALADKVASWRAGYTASGPSKTAAAWIERAVGGEIKEQLAKKAPEIANIDKLFSLLYKGQEKSKKLLWTGLKTAGLARLLGL